MRALVPVAIVAIIAITTLLLVRMIRRQEARRRDFFRLNHELHEARSLITRIEGEIETQWAGDYPDIPELRRILREYRTATDTQEIAR